MSVARFRNPYVGENKKVQQAVRPEVPAVFLCTVRVETASFAPAAAKMANCFTYLCTGCGKIQRVADSKAADIV
jgi:hypothetical protein